MNYITVPLFRNAVACLAWTLVDAMNYFSPGAYVGNVKGVRVATGTQRSHPVGLQSVYFGKTCHLDCKQF